MPILAEYLANQTPKRDCLMGKNGEIVAAIDFIPN